MKQRFLWTLLGLVLPVLMMTNSSRLFSNPVGKDEARQKALLFINERHPAMARGAQLNLSLALTNESYHVFNLGTEDGFVIISGDDCTDDILGYSDSGTFDAQNMPENLRAWLQGYADQIAWMKANGVKASSNTSRDGSRLAVRKAPKNKISPLLTSRWGQGDPYNQQTPTINGTHCVTGCVATALAQLMYYWYKKENFKAELEKDIPACSDVSPSLEKLSAPETFDWAHMTDNYNSNSTTTEEDAVAELMKYCGYSVKMDYGTNGSSARGVFVAAALTDYFGFETARAVLQDQYSYEDWQQVIYTDLAAGRPVVVGGLSKDGGHEFICDGYDEDDYFHFNWGWRGSSDGYYKLSLCDPDDQGIGGSSGGYYIGQHAISCAHPTESINLPIQPMETVSADDIEVTSISIPTLTAGEAADITVTIKNNNTTASLNRDIVISLSNGTVWERVGASTAHIKPETTVSITIPIVITLLSKGSYNLNVFYQNYDKNLQTIHSEVVTIGAALQRLKGTVNIDDTHAEAGIPSSYTLSGTVASLSASTVHPRWQVSKNGEDRWEDIDGATSTTYTPKGTDVGKYIRVIVKADDYHGELVSDGREVHKTTLLGTVEYSNTSKSPGDNLACSISGAAASIDPASIQRQWQRSSYSLFGWTDITGQTGPYYNLKPADVGYYFRLKVSSEDCIGELYSPSRKCVKWDCVKQVVAPELEVSTAYNQVRVTNPQTAQEYIILDYKKEIKNLTESDWKNAKTFGEGETILLMGGTLNKANYVYTRVKETETALAGIDVRREGIYLGETTYLEDFSLRVDQVVKVTDWFTNYMSLEQDDLGAYYMTGGETYRIRVFTVPVNATFNGIKGSNWLVKGSSRTSKWGTYYADEECTTVIDADTYYKRVWFKPQDNEPINYMELRAEYTKGYNDILTDAFQVNVARNDGTYKVDQVYAEEVTIEKGKKVAGEKYTTRPEKASPKSITSMLTNSESIDEGDNLHAPEVVFNQALKYFSVDATEASKGTFWYTIYSNHVGVGTLRVNVTTPPVEEMLLLPKKFQLDCGQSLQLEVQLFPLGAEEKITWTSSDESVAKVSEDGVVTVMPGTDIGATATITATIPVGDGTMSETCELTVPGEKYDLYLAGTQVTTRNMNDLGEMLAGLSDEAMEKYFSGDMEIMFNGDMLYLKNVIIDATGRTAQGMTLGIKNTILMVEGECKVKSNIAGLKVARNATITGDGQLSLEGKDYGILFNGRGFTAYDRDTICLTINGGTIVATGNERGVQAYQQDNHSMVINSAKVTINSPGGAIYNLMGGLTMNNCLIKSPEKAKVRDGCVWTSDDNLATMASIVPFITGDVNNDGAVDVADIGCIIDIMAGKETTFLSARIADVNNDGTVAVADIGAIIDIMAGKDLDPSIKE